MKYRIQITKVEPNPKYDPNRRSYNPPPREFEHTALTMDLTAREFDAVRRACLVVMGGGNDERITIRGAEE